MTATETEKRPEWTLETMADSKDVHYNDGKPVSPCHNRSHYAHKKDMQKMILTLVIEAIRQNKEWRLARMTNECDGLVFPSYVSVCVLGVCVLCNNVKEYDSKTRKYLFVCHDILN